MSRLTSFTVSKSFRQDSVTSLSVARLFLKILEAAEEVLDGTLIQTEIIFSLIRGAKQCKIDRKT